MPEIPGKENNGRVTLVVFAKAIRLVLLNRRKKTTMSNNNTQTTDEQLSSDNQGGTLKTCVFLTGIQCRYSQVVYLEVPSDATEEEIMNLGESAWKQLAPPDEWVVDVAVQDVWEDEVDFDFSDVPDGAAIDARIARTNDGQLVVLAK